MTDYYALLGFVFCLFPLDMEIVQRWYHKDSCFSHTGLCLADYWVSSKGFRYRMSLNCTRMLKSTLIQSSTNLRPQKQIFPAAKRKFSSITLTNLFKIHFKFLFFFWILIIRYNFLLSHPIDINPRIFFIIYSTLYIKKWA